MNTVQTIQDALDRRASQEGAEQARRLIEALPQIGALTFTAKTGGEVLIDGYIWRDVLLMAVTKRLTERRLQELTRELLESINEIAALKEGLEQRLQKNEN